MATLMTVEQKRRWTEIHDLLNSLLQNPGKLDAMTDLFYKLIWDEGLKPHEETTLQESDNAAAASGG